MNNEDTETTETYVTKVVNNIDQKGLAPKSKSDTMCAPGLEYKAGSCARLVVLVELAEAYNKSAQNQDKIRLASNMELLNPQIYKRYLVHELSKRMGDKCKSQKCWSKQEFMRNVEEKAREEFMKYTLRPDSPQGKFEWLSTFNINDSMDQYEKKYNGFKFFGAIPMDFADLSQLEINNINYDNLQKNGITKIGVIFNLDEHYKPGSHWVAMYTDFKKGNIYYFDSFGTKPEKRVRSLIRKHAKYMNSKGINSKNIIADYNKIQHQKENSECGVYSMNFLIRMARGDDFQKLCKNAIPDKKINKCRSIYFDKHIHKK